MFRSRITTDGLHEYLEPDRIRATILPRVSSVQHIDEIRKQGLAYTQMLDLLFTFSIPYPTPECNSAHIRVSDALLKSAGITLDEAITCARQNAREDVSLDVLGNVLAALTGTKTPFGDGLWVLSNSQRAFGSGVLLCPDVLQNAADMMDAERLIILPSSIHEVLCLKDEGMDTAYLLDMVIDINATQVSADDKLTDNVYFFRNGKLESLVTIE